MTPETKELVKQWDDRASLAREDARTSVRKATGLLFQGRVDLATHSLGVAHGLSILALEAEIKAVRAMLEAMLEATS